MNDVLVVKLGFKCSEQRYKQIYENILKQMDHGLVVLPHGYDAFVVRRDCDLKVKNRACKDVIKKIPKTCSICLHRDSLPNEDPCKSCEDFSNFTFKGCV